MDCVIGWFLKKIHTKQPAKIVAGMMNTEENTLPKDRKVMTIVARQLFFMNQKNTACPVSY